MTPLRAPWHDRTKDALICAAETLVKQHPRYAAAKGGSLHDAWALSSEILSRVPGSDLAPLLSDQPTLVAVQGGTLANLRGYFVSRGGTVDFCVALTGQARSAKIALSQ